MNALEIRKPSTPSRAASDPDPEVPAKARSAMLTPTAWAHAQRQPAAAA